VDAATGKVIWKSDKFKSSDRIPNLNIVNGVLIAQFGGMINRQLYWSNNNGQYWKSENHFDGDFGVRAYDLNTGASLWDTHQLKDKLDDKFSDRITTIYGVGNNLVVASDKNVFCLDAKNGSVVYKTPISPSKIGDVFELLVSEDNTSLYVLCDQGVASVEINSGKLRYATKTGEIFWKEIPGTDTYSFSHGANYFLRIGEKEFIGFDLAKGNIKGKMKNKVHPSFTEDGNFIFDRDDEAMTKYAVNKP
jgi:outer membrane protein assembly factor BamB